MNELISITFSTAETDPSIFLLYLTNKLMDAHINILGAIFIKNR